MTSYAKGTAVSPRRSKEEIERNLARFGAKGLSITDDWENGLAIVQFKAHGFIVEFRLTLPKRENYRYTEARGYLRSDADTQKHWEQACAEHWRALSAVIKAKLVGVEAGITCFEKEFLAHIMLPDGTGRTVGDCAIPALEEGYRNGGRVAGLLGSEVQA